MNGSTCTKVGKWDWSDNFVIKQSLKPRGLIILSNVVAFITFILAWFFLFRSF